MLYTIISWLPTKFLEDLSFFVNVELMDREYRKEN